MKTTIIPAIAAVLIGGLSSTAWAITPAEEASVLFMKQEEKLARDVYQVFHGQWGARIFGNFAASEQTHMNAVDTLIARYELDDPTPAEPGEYTYPELQELYDQLVVDGAESLAAALEVGVAIETKDIADLRNSLAVTTDANVRRVFSNLLNGSLRHLAAFENYDEATAGTGAGKGKKAKNRKAKGKKGKANKAKNRKAKGKRGNAKGKGGKGKGKGGNSGN